MIKVKASVEINKTPQEVWNYVSRIDEWWLTSNPKEHIELSVVGNGPINKETEFILKERIAGIRGEALAKVVEYAPPAKLIWKSLQAKFKLLAVTVNVEEGGTFEISETDNGCVLSHEVWEKLHAGPVAGLIEWFFKHILKGELRDFQHTHRELLYVKREIERRSV